MRGKLFQIVKNIISLIQSLLLAAPIDPTGEPSKKLRLYLTLGNIIKGRMVVPSAFIVQAKDSTCHLSAVLTHSALLFPCWVKLCQSWHNLSHGVHVKVYGAGNQNLRNHASN